MKKSIITVVGKDRVGIIAKVCVYLADNSVNILDISQTIVEGYFNMMMIVDLANCTKEIAVVVNEMDATRRKQLAYISLHSRKKSLKKCIVCNLG